MSKTLMARKLGIVSEYFNAKLDLILLVVCFVFDLYLVYFGM